MLISKIISGGQGGDRTRGSASLSVAAARDAGFPYGGLIPKGKLAEDGIVPLEFVAMIEDTRKDYLHRTELNVINSDATLILSRTRELTDGSRTSLGGFGVPQSLLL